MSESEAWDWLDKHNDDPLMDEFYRLFGIRFGIIAGKDKLYYTDENNNSYYTPDDETECWNMVVESVKIGRNLFLDFPVDDDEFKFPDGVLV